MKAQEVIDRYAAGDRNFCNANLRGANFQNQNLSWADFSGADIRSANFNNAKLHRVKFTKARAGLQRRWLVARLLLIVLLAGIAGGLQGFFGALAADLLESSTEGLIAGGTYLLLLTVVYGALALQGFSLKAVGAILSVFAFAVAVAVAFADSFPVDFAVTFVLAVLVAGIGAFAIALACGLTGAIAVSGTDSFVIAVIVTVAVALLLAGIGALSGTGAFGFAVAAALTLAGALLILHIGRQVLIGHDKFWMVRSFGLVIAALGGTSFRGADLTGATFRKARLKNTNFADSKQRKTTITHVCWQGTEKLNRSRLGETILQDNRVRRLLTMPESGYRQNLTGADLRGAHLRGVTLEGAVLRRANLSNATLEKAVLKDAILTGARATSADFTGACLTGATLEAWTIDSTTHFKNVDCQYVFLREDLIEGDHTERRPRNPTTVFQPGDFETIFKEMLDDAKSLVRHGIEPLEFRTPFQRAAAENPELAEGTNITSHATTDSRGAITVVGQPALEGTNSQCLESQDIESEGIESEGVAQAQIECAEDSGYLPSIPETETDLAPDVATLASTDGYGNEAFLMAPTLADSPNDDVRTWCTYPFDPSENLEP